MAQGQMCHCAFLHASAGVEPIQPDTFIYKTFN